MQETMAGITFNGAKSFLSNFHPCEIHHDGFDFASSEHLYQYLKCKANKDFVRAKRVMEAITGPQAKMAANGLIYLV